jgi:hypothetical protein
MTATVRINYDRYVNTGLVPGTDYENQVLDEILEWAGETFDADFEASLPDLIDLYWMHILEGVIYEKIA